MRPYYQDSHVTIYHKDCRDMSEVEDESVDLVLTVPPYGVGKDYGDLVCDTMTPTEYLDWTRSWFSLFRGLAPCMVLTVGITNLPMWIADIERTHKIIAWIKENEPALRQLYL